MPPLVLLAAAGLGVYTGYRVIRDTLKRIETEAERGMPGSGPETPPRDLGPLEWDAVNGVYRPRK